MKTLPTSLLGFAALLLPCATQAATIGYWRMEVDNDAGAAAVSVPNEVAGNVLTSASATLDSAVPVNPVPQTGAANTKSLNGSTDINATVAAYTALNVPSITIELFARTTESGATYVSRGDGVTDGFIISTPSNMTIRYATDNGAGGVTSNLLTIGDVNSNAWFHIAFTYDQATGIGSTYVNGVFQNMINGPDNRGLVWNAGTGLGVGTLMDGGTVSSGSTAGTLDELRISDTALTPSQFLNAVPEPGSALLALGSGMGLLGMMRRRGQVAH